MSYSDKAKVATSVSEFSTLDLSCQHVTTCNFMETTVAKCLEIVPNQSINIAHRLFSRLEPMPVPTFGNANIHTNTYFVPFRTIMPSWNEFITDSVYVYDNEHSDIPQNVHLIKNTTFVDMFVTPLFSTAVEETSAYDFVVVARGSTLVQPYRLTPVGKVVLKLVMSLGYKIDFKYNNNEFYHSALPMLALLKVYYDWYYPSAYSQDELAVRAQFLLNYDDPELSFDEFVTGEMLGRYLYDIAHVCYNSDYLVSSWDNPVSPNNGSYSNNARIDDITFDYYDGANVVNTTGTPVIAPDNGPIPRISQFMIDSLKSLTDYVKRNQLSGARVVDRYLARYGVTLSSAQLKRSQLISRHKQEIKFGDVTSTSDTEGASLGAYAGKGVSYGVNDIEFKSDEFGILIMITSIVPKVSFYQGQDRMTMHKSRFDFYTSEFDNQGVQALSTREVYVPLDARNEYPSGVSSYPSIDYNSLVFGFVPRYGEYKRGYDLITGDYVLGSQNVGKDAWTLFRDLTPFFKDGVADTKHDIDFVQGLDRSQYNRIFYVTDPLVDHFNLIHDFNIVTRFPGKPLYDTYEFENEDDAKKVVMEVNGVKAN